MSDWGGGSVQHRVPRPTDELTSRDTSTADVSSSLSLIFFFKLYFILFALQWLLVWWSQACFLSFSRLIVILWSCKMVTSLRAHLRLLFTLIEADMFIKLPGCCWQSHFLLSKRRGGKCCLNWLKPFLFVVLKHVVFSLQSSIVGQCTGHHFSNNYFSVLEVVFQPLFVFPSYLNRFFVKEGTPSFIILVKGSTFSKQFSTGKKIRRLWGRRTPNLDDYQTQLSHNNKNK